MIEQQNITVNVCEDICPRNYNLQLNHSRWRLQMSFSQRYLTHFFHEVPCMINAYLQVLTLSQTFDN